MGDEEMMDTADADYTLVVSGERIPVQRARLAAHSRYFQAMFSLDMKESGGTEAELREIAPGTVRTLVGYTHTGELGIHGVDSALEILSGAGMLQFDGALDVCNNYLLDRIAPDNCLSIMHMADANGLNRLFNKSKIYSLWYFSRVIQDEDFLHLPVELLKDYIDTSSINVSSEYEVFKAIKLWIAFAPTEREQYFPELFEFLRLNSLTHADMRRILDYDVIQKYTQCAGAVEEMLAPSIFESCKAADTQRKRRKSEKNITLSRQVPKTIWSVGGDFMNATERWSNQTVSEFNTEAGQFKEVSRLPMFQEGVAWGYRACCLGKDLFIVGGEVKQGIRPTWLMDIYKYDIIEDRWSVVGRMDHPRRHHGMVAHGDYIYVAGGFGKHRIMQNTAAKFCISTGEWEQLPNLPSAIFAAPMCMSNGHLYCMKSMIHYLSPGARHWSTIKQSIPYDMGVQCAIPHRDKLYLLGSHVKHLTEYDTVTGTYTDLGSFQKAMGQGCIFRDKIYVFCGEEAENIESYNLVTKEFKHVTKLQHCMFNHSVVVVPSYPTFR